MSQTSIKKEKTKEIETHEEFQRALLKKQGAIASDPYPTLEVAEDLFMALAEGQPINSLTYGKPGVRVFKTGTTDQVLDSEDVSADVFLEKEIRRINEASKR